MWCRAVYRCPPIDPLTLRCRVHKNVVGEPIWVKTTADQVLPPLAILAGCDEDGDEVYVARAYHDGTYVPGKVVPKKRKASFGWDLKEIEMHEIEVLTGHNWIWQPSSNGRIPDRACPAGHTPDGEALYIGRGTFQSNETCGKVHPTHGCLFITHAGREKKIHEYDILVQREYTTCWVPAIVGHLPPWLAKSMVPGGIDTDGEEIYLGRSYHAGDLLPGKVVKGQAYVGWDLKEHSKNHFECLTGKEYAWKADSHGRVPQNALICGRTRDGEPLYFGRGPWKGSLTPGKIHPSHGCLFIPFGGEEIRLISYEVLVYP